MRANFVTVVNINFPRGKKLFSITLLETKANRKVEIRHPTRSVSKVSPKVEKRIS